MSRPGPMSELSLQALLDSAKEVPRQPQAVRERVLARARATAAAPLPQPVPAPAPRPRLPNYMLAPAAAVLGVGIAGVVVALGGGWPRSPALPAAAVQSPAVQSPAAANPPSERDAPSDAPAPVTPKAEVDTTPGADSARHHGRRQEETQESNDAELRLMRSAHTAYAAHEYANALVLVGEHARRFPSGLLAEEREALRVRCLLGSGHTREAQRAATAFAARFPRSVLLPRIEAEVGAHAE